MKRVLSNRRARAAVVVGAVLLLALVPVLIWGQSPPTAPTILFVHSTDAQAGNASPATGVDLTPVFSATFNDSDLGAIGQKIKIQVSTDQTFATVSHWNSGQISIADVANASRCANVDYNGSALAGLATYYWRCRFWDEANAAGAWSASATFTTEPAPLAPIGLFVDSTDASAGSGGNPVEEIDQTPVFTAVFGHQSNSSPAQQAKIQVSTDPTFATITNWNSGQLTISNTSNGSRTPNIAYGGQALSGDTTYYWRIRLTDSSGNTGPWSTEAASFHTNVVPSQPTALQVGSTEAQTGSSGNPVAGIDLTPVFSALFNHPTGGITSTKVKIQVTTDSSFNSITHWNSGKVTIASVTAGSRCADVAYNGQALAGLQTYYWRARFFDANGGVGEWSTEAASFSTAGAILAPDILFVGNTEAQTGSQGNPVNLVDLNPAFSAIYHHQSVGSPGKKAKVQVTTDPTFADITNWNSGQLDIADVAAGQRCADVAYSGQLLHGNTRYYWRLRFYDVNGVAGPWSTEAASFVTILAPIEPTVLYIGSNAAQAGASGNPVVDLDLSPVFSAVFNHQDEAGIGKKIRIQVSTDSTFNTITHWNSGNINVADVLNLARCRDVSYAGAALASATTYYWRCRFVDAYPSTGPWSVEAASFTTATDVNHPPVIDATGDFLVYEGGVLDFPVSVNDPDAGSIVTVTVSQEGAASLPAGASLTAGNRFQWVPNFQQAGSYTFIIIATDNAPAPESSTAIFHVTVVNVNRSPTVSIQPVVNVDEGQSVTIQINVADPDSADTQTLEIAMASGAALPAGVSLDPTLRQIVWQTRYDQAGSYEFVVTARDNGNPALNGFAPVTVVVANVPHSVEVVQHSPTDGQIGVASSAQISVEFSEPVALPSAESFMVSSSRGGRISGVFSASGSSIIFTAAHALPAGESVIVTLTTAIVSPLGAPLSGNLSWQFRVAATVSPAGFSRDEVFVNTTIENGATILPLDFDLDGAVDFFAIARSSGLPNKLYRNVSGQFVPVTTVGVGLEGPSGAVVMDFDNDGRPDLVQWYANSAFLYRNDGASFALFGSFVHGISIPSDAIAGDLTGDGRPEFAICSTTGHVAVFNALLGDFTLLGSLDLPSAASTTCVLGSTGPRQGGPRLIAGFGAAIHVVTTLANATLTLESSQPVPGDYVRHVEVADANSDGMPDIVVLTTDLSILTGNAVGFGAASVISWPAAGATSFELSDLDGDNDVDLVCVYPTEALIGLGQGNANTFTRHETISTGLGSESILLQTVTADFNADGKVDLLASRNNGNLQVFLNGQRIGVSVQDATVTAPTTGAGEILIPVVLDHVPVNQVLVQFETFEEPPPSGGGDSDAVGDISDMMKSQTSGSGWYTATSGVLTFGRGVTTMYIHVPISATFAQPSVLQFSIRILTVIPSPVVFLTASTVISRAAAISTVTHVGAWSSPPATAPQTRDWRVDGKILATVQDPAGNTYFGGAFNSVSWSAPSFATRSLNSGLKSAISLPLSSGDKVYAVEHFFYAGSPSTYDIYVGGQFTFTFGADTYRNLVRIRNGNIDSTFRPNPRLAAGGGWVRMLRLDSSGASLYVGGTLDTADLKPSGTPGGTPAATSCFNLFRCGVDQTKAACAGAGGLGAEVLDLDFDSSTALAVGHFDRAYSDTYSAATEDTTRRGFVAFNNGGLVQSDVWTVEEMRTVLVVSSGRILIGGHFSTGSTPTQHNLMEVNFFGSSYVNSAVVYQSQTGTPSNRPREVNDLLMLPATQSNPQRLIVAQDGSNASTPQEALVYYDIQGTGPFMCSAFSSVIQHRFAKSLTFDPIGKRLWVGAADAPSQTWFSTNLACYIADEQSASYTFLDNTAAGDVHGTTASSVFAVLVTSRAGTAAELAVGGDFQRLAVQRGNLAACDSTGSLLHWSPRANGVVRAMALNGTNIYFGGDFTILNRFVDDPSGQFGGLSRQRLARASTNPPYVTWIDSTWVPSADGSVHALELDIVNDNLYLGGSFSSVNSTAHNGLAAVFASNGGVRLWAPDVRTGSVSGTVMTLALYGTDVFIGGRFDTVNGATRNNAASISTVIAGVATNILRSWAPSITDGSGVASGAELHALSIDSHSGTMFIGGLFQRVGMATVQNLAAVDSSGLPVIGWACDAQSGAVHDLALTLGGSLYVAGEFTTIGGANLRGLVVVDSRTGVVNSTWQPQPVFQVGGGVFSLTIASPASGGMRLLVAGSFDSISQGLPDITWFALPVEITPPTLTVAEEGVQYSDQLGLSIATAVTWTFGASLPAELQPWLHLGALSGTLDGTPPTGLVPSSMTERLFNVPVIANVSGGSVQRTFILRVVSSPRVFIVAPVLTPTPPHLEFLETNVAANWISNAIEVRLSRPSLQAIDVEIEAINGTAADGRDFVLSQTVAHFAPQQVSCYLPLCVFGDTIAGLNPREFGLRVRSVLAGSAAILTTTPVPVWIIEDDLPGPRMAVAADVRVMNDLQWPAEQNHVIANTPFFAWTFYSDDPQRTQSQFSAAVFADAALQNLLWQGNGTTNSSVQSGITLADGQQYWLRVVLTDDQSHQGTPTVLPFKLNTAPPVVSSLTAGAITDSTPSLEFTAPVDADGDALHFIVRLTKVSGGGVTVVESANFLSAFEYLGSSGFVSLPAQGLLTLNPTTVRFTVPPFAALENGDYTWSVVVTDSFETTLSPTPHPTLTLSASYTIRGQVFSAPAVADQGERDVHLVRITTGALLDTYRINAAGGTLTNGEFEFTVNHALVVGEVLAFYLGDSYPGSTPEQGSTLRQFGGGDMTAANGSNETVAITHGILSVDQRVGARITGAAFANPLASPYDARIGWSNPSTADVEFSDWIQTLEIHGSLVILSPSSSEPAIARFPAHLTSSQATSLLAGASLTISDGAVYEADHLLSVGTVIVESGGLLEVHENSQVGGQLHFLNGSRLICENSTVTLASGSFAGTGVQITDHTGSSCLEIAGTATLDISGAVLHSTRLLVRQNANLVRLENIRFEGQVNNLPTATGMPSHLRWEKQSSAGAFVSSGLVFATPLVAGITANISATSSSDVLTAYGAVGIGAGEAFDDDPLDGSADRVRFDVAEVTGLIAEAGDTRIRLRWSNAGQVGAGLVFWVFTDTSLAFSAPVLLAEATTPEFIDVGLSNGTPKFYFVSVGPQGGTASQEVVSARSLPTVSTPGSADVALVAPIVVAANGTTSLTVAGIATHWTAGIQITSSNSSVVLDSQTIFSPNETALFFDLVGNSATPGSQFTLTLRQENIWGLIGYNEEFVLILSVAETYGAAPPVITFEATQGGILDGARTSGPFTIYLNLEQNGGAPIDYQSLEFFSSGNVSVSGLTVGLQAQQPGVLSPGENLALPSYQIFEVHPTFALAQVEQLTSQQMGQTLPAGVEAYEKGTYGLRARIRNIYGVWSSWATAAAFVEGLANDVAILEGVLLQGTTQQLTFHGTGLSSVSSVDFTQSSGVTVDPQTISSSGTQPAPGGMTDYVWTATFVTSKAATLGVAEAQIGGTSPQPRMAASIVRCPTSLLKPEGSPNSIPGPITDAIGVDVRTREFVWQEADLATKSRVFPVQWSRNYSSKTLISRNGEPGMGPLGHGWWSNYHQYVFVNSAPGGIPNTFSWFGPNGRFLSFVREFGKNLFHPVASSGWADSTGYFEKLPGGNEDHKVIVIRDSGGLTYRFARTSGSGAGQAFVYTLSSVADGWGNRHTLDYEPGGGVGSDTKENRLLHVYDDVASAENRQEGECIQLQYDANGRISAVVHNRIDSGTLVPLRRVEYEYDPLSDTLTLVHIPDVPGSTGVKKGYGYVKSTSPQGVDFYFLDHIYSPLSCVSTSVGTINASASTPFLVNDYGIPALGTWFGVDGKVLGQTTQHHVSGGSTTPALTYSFLQGFQTQPFANLTVTDPEGHKTYYLMKDNLPIEVERIKKGSTTGAVHKFEYDGRGRVVKHSWPRLVDGKPRIAEAFYDMGFQVVLDGSAQNISAGVPVDEIGTYDVQTNSTLLTLGTSVHTWNAADKPTYIEFISAGQTRNYSIVDVSNTQLTIVGDLLGSGWNLQTGVHYASGQILVKFYRAAAEEFASWNPIQSIDRPAGTSSVLDERVSKSTFEVKNVSQGFQIRSPNSVAPNGVETQVEHLDSGRADDALPPKAAGDRWVNQVTKVRNAWMSQPVLGSAITFTDEFKSLSVWDAFGRIRSSFSLGAKNSPTLRDDTFDYGDTSSFMKLQRWRLYRHTVEYKTPSKEDGGIAKETELYDVTDVFEYSYVPETGRLESELDPRGKADGSADHDKTKYEWDERDQLRKLQSPSPNGSSLRPTTFYFYDEAGNLATQLDDHIPGAAMSASSHSTPSTSDSAETVWANRSSLNSTVNGPNSPGWIVQHWIYDLCGRPLKHEWQEIYSSIANPDVYALTDVEASSVYDGLGRLTDSIDPNEKTTKFAYNEFGNVVEVRRPPDGETIIETRQYDRNQNLLAVTQADEQPEYFGYDGFDRPVLHIGLRNNAEFNLATLTSYPLPNTKIAEIKVRELNTWSTSFVPPNELESWISARVKALSQSTDILHERRAFVDGFGHTFMNAEWAYNSQQPKAPLLHSSLHDGKNWTFSGTSFDAKNLTVEYMVNESKARVWNTSDGMGQCARTVVSNDAASGPHWHGYAKIINALTDYNKVMVRTEEGGVFNSRDYIATSKTTFDTQSRPIEIIDEDGLVSTLSYGITGGVWKSVDPAGQVNCVEYDWSGRVVAMYLLDGTSRRTERRNVFDQVGNLLAEAVQISGKWNVTKYLYDSRNRRTAMFTPDGMETSYTYDELDRLETTTYHQNGVSVSYSYSSSGLMIGWEIDAGTIGGVQKEKFDYDSRGRMTRSRSCWAGSTFDLPTVDINWEYNSLDLPEKQTETVRFPDGNGLVDVFFGQMDDVTGVARPSKTGFKSLYGSSGTAIGSVSSWDMSASYDAGGNRIGEEFWDGRTIQHTVDKGLRTSTEELTGGDQATNIGTLATYLYTGKSRLAQRSFGHVGTRGPSYKTQVQTITHPSATPANRVFEIDTYRESNKLVNRYLRKLENGRTVASRSHLGGAFGSIYGFDSHYRLTSSSQGIQLTDNQLAYGSTTALPDPIATPSIWARQLVYGYDEAGNRSGGTGSLIGVTEKLRSGTVTRETISYTMDKPGAENLSMQKYERAESDLHATSDPLKYDKLSRLTSDPATGLSYDYDVHGRVISVKNSLGEIQKFVYDSFGRKTLEISGTNDNNKVFKLIVPDIAGPGGSLGANEAAEIDFVKSGSGFAANDLVQFTNGLGMTGNGFGPKRICEFVAYVRTVEGQGPFYRFLHEDPLGTTTFATDQFADRTDEFSYSDYGTPIWRPVLLDVPKDKVSAVTPFGDKTVFTLSGLTLTPGSLAGMEISVTNENNSVITDHVRTSIVCGNTTNTITVYDLQDPQAPLKEGQFRDTYNASTIKGLTVYDFNHGYLQGRVEDVSFPHTYGLFQVTFVDDPCGILNSVNFVPSEIRPVGGPGIPIHDTFDSDGDGIVDRIVIIGDATGIFGQFDWYQLESSDPRVTLSGFVETMPTYNSSTKSTTLLVDEWAADHLSIGQKGWLCQPNSREPVYYEITGVDPLARTITLAGNAAAILKEYLPTTRDLKRDERRFRLFAPPGVDRRLELDGAITPVPGFQTTHYLWSAGIYQTPPTSFKEVGFTTMPAPGIEGWNKHGTYEMWNRLYDPWLGRFTSTDRARSPGYNLFEYAKNDPFHMYDPEGLWAFDAFGLHVTNKGWSKRFDATVEGMAFGVADMVDDVLAPIFGRKAFDDSDREAMVWQHAQNGTARSFVYGQVAGSTLYVATAAAATGGYAASLTPGILAALGSYGGATVITGASLGTGGMLVGGIVGGATGGAVAGAWMSAATGGGWRDIVTATGSGAVFGGALGFAGEAGLSSWRYLRTPAPIRWTAWNGPGPLGEEVANTFRGGSYTQSVLSEETTLYRVYGGNARQLGSYWTRTPPAGPMQSTIDSALDPAWGNNARNIAAIRVPAGTTIYEGYTAPQGRLLGGGNQVYIRKGDLDPKWFVK